MSLQEFQSPYYHVQAAPQDYTIDATTFTLSTGRYFLFGSAYSVSISSLLLEMTSDIGTAFTAFADYIDYNADTGRVFFQFSTTRSVNWTNNALRDALGFTGNLSGAASYIAPNPPKFSWRPSREPSYFYGIFNDPSGAGVGFLPRSSTIIKRNDSGNVWYNEGYTHNVNRLEYDSLKFSETIVPVSGTSTALDYQTFWTYTAARGLPFYCVYDRVFVGLYSVVFFFGVSVAGFVGYHADFADDEIGNISKNITRTQQDYNQLWNVSIPIYKNV